MKVSLISTGSGWNLYLKKSILQLIGCKPPQTKVSFTIKNKILYIQNIDFIDMDKITNKMIRNFNKSGSGWGLFIPNPVIELLDINPEIDKVELDVNDNILLVKKA